MGTSALRRSGHSNGAGPVNETQPGTDIERGKSASRSVDVSPFPDELTVLVDASDHECRISQHLFIEQLHLPRPASIEAIGTVIGFGKSSEAALIRRLRFACGPSLKFLREPEKLDPTT